MNVTFGNTQHCDTSISKGLVHFSLSLSLLPAKVAKFEHSSLWVEQEVLRLDVSVTHTIRMDIGQGAEQLVHVQLGSERTSKKG